MIIRLPMTQSIIAAISKEYGTCQFVTHVKMTIMRAEVDPSAETDPAGPCTYAICIVTMPIVLKMLSMKPIQNSSQVKCSIY